MAFYRAFQPKATWYDKFVALGTSSHHSHVEIVLEKNKGISISPRENCFRAKEIDFQHGPWDLVYLDLNKAEKSKIKLFLKLQPWGRYRYDYFQVLQTKLRCCFPTKYKMSSIEMSANLLSNLDRFYDIPIGCKLTPNELFMYLLKKENNVYLQSKRN